MRLHQPSGRGRQGRDRFACLGQLAAHVREATLDAQDLECPPFEQAQADLPLTPHDAFCAGGAPEHPAATHNHIHTATNYQSAAVSNRQARRLAGFNRVGDERSVVARDVARAERAAGTETQECRPPARESGLLLATTDGTSTTAKLATAKLATTADLTAQGFCLDDGCGYCRVVDLPLRALGVVHRVPRCGLPDDPDEALGTMGSTRTMPVGVETLRSLELFPPVARFEECGALNRTVWNRACWLSSAKPGTAAPRPERRIG